MRKLVIAAIALAHCGSGWAQGEADLGAEAARRAELASQWRTANDAFAVELREAARQGALPGDDVLTCDQIEAEGAPYQARLDEALREGNPPAIFAMMLEPRAARLAELHQNANCTTP